MLWSAWVSVVCCIRVFRTITVVLHSNYCHYIGIIQCSTSTVTAHGDGTASHRSQRSVTSLNTLGPSATQLTVATYGSNGGRQSEGG